MEKLNPRCSKEYVHSSLIMIVLSIQLNRKLIPQVNSFDLYFKNTKFKRNIYIFNPAGLPSQSRRGGC